MTVTVEVGDDTGSGTLVTTVNYPDDKAEMTNTYSASGKATIEIEKKLSTGAKPAANKYEFQLKKGEYLYMAVDGSQAGAAGENVTYNEQNGYNDEKLLGMIDSLYADEYENGESCGVSLGLFSLRPFRARLTKTSPDAIIVKNPLSRKERSMKTVLPSASRRRGEWTATRPVSASVWVKPT